MVLGPFGVWVFVGALRVWGFGVSGFRALLWGLGFLGLYGCRVLGFRVLGLYRV